MILAKMLRLYLDANDLDQKTAAQQMKINESTLSRFMSGQTLPDAENFMRILLWATGTRRK